MYQPDLSTLACLLASGLWLTAGLRLFMDGTRHGSRPDFVLALGLISGGALLGTGCTPWAGQGVFPLAGLMLAIASFWAFGLGLADEATGLQRGERGLNIAGALATVVALHFAASLFGAQPAIDVGFVLRPFEPLVAGLLVYLWVQARRLPPDFFLGAENHRVRGLLWATAGASVASFFGGGLGDGVAFLLLSVAVAPLIKGWVASRDLEVRRSAAVAAAAMLVALGMAMGDHLVRHQNALQSVQSAAARVARSQESLQAPVNESVAHWVGEQPEIRYAARSTAAFQQLTRLHQSSRVWPVPGLRAAVERIERSAIHHARWSRSTFQAVEMRHAALGDGTVRHEHEQRALAAMREATLALDRGREGLADLQRAVAAGGAVVTEESQRLGGLLLAVLVVLILLGGAFLAAARTADELSVARAEDEVIAATAADVAAVAAELVDMPDNDPVAATCEEPDPFLGPWLTDAAAPEQPTEATPEP